MQTDKEIFKEYCSKEAGIPIFLTYDWMELVAEGGKWDVIVEIRGETLAGFLVYFYKKKSFFSHILMPLFTPYTGIWIKYPAGQKNTTKISYEKEVTSILIDKLPRFDHYFQTFYPSFTNWLPFYWRGFKQTTRYTYVISDLTNLDLIFNGFRENIRREIRKAQKSLKVIESKEIDRLFTFLQDLFNSQKLSLPFSRSFFMKVFAFIENKGCGKLLAAVDESGKPYAMVLFLWDNESTYYFSGAADLEKKNSGALSLLLWEGIKITALEGKKQFNFEGSMIEPIERFFRSFGANQVPYFQIYKENSGLFRLLRKAKTFFSKL